MKRLMRCQFCGLLQDEPVGVKVCERCGGELMFEDQSPTYGSGSYLDVQMELDQINAPTGQTVDRYLMVCIRTPENIPDEHQAKTESGRPPLSCSIVLDVSGSMRGRKMENTKQALRLAARLLRDGDQVALTTFSDRARQILPSTNYGKNARTVFESAVDEIEAGGMTALFSGLELGLEQAQKMRSDTDLTLLLSDGQANVGETDLEVVGNLAKKAADTGLIVSTLGVGANYNEALMTEIATQGRGRFYHVQSADEIVPYMTGELGEAADLAARDVRIHIQLPNGSALIPLSAAYACEVVKGEAIISVGDIPADLEVEIPLRLTLFSGKENDRIAVEGHITYVTPAGSNLLSDLNRVTVRFIKQNRFKVALGVVQPVAVRVAKQLHARQVLDYSRAFSRGDEEKMQQVEEDRSRLRVYVNHLDKDLQAKMIHEMDQDMYSVRNASPQAKSAVYQAYQTQRSMRDHKRKK
ncbi:MAG: VWA domain-containing protein [Chloroflexota bacterium]|nr:VWA domain-containing protein [Chloroflexota bacterium]